MTLILLFLPHKSTPPSNQGAFTPGVLSAIETFRPSLILVEKSEGVFTTSTITYSSASNTYNGGLYGGADRSLPEAAVVFAIDTIKPTLVLVEDSTGQFTTSSIQYSSATNTYNSGLYGGMDMPRPNLAVLNIDTIKPVLHTVDKF